MSWKYVDGRNQRSCKAMPHKDPLQPQQCAERLSALAAPERLRIIRLLRDGPKSVGAISEALQIPLLNLSHHLSVLKQNGFLNREKKGRFVLYSLAPNVVASDIEPAEGDVLNLGCCRLELPKS
jgi:DNA-binding transcriptional ArsR family regulator